MTSQSYDAGSLVRYYYVKDHIGNIRQTLDHSGTIVAAQDYYSYGEYIRSYNQGLPNDRYKFTGKERDNETNLDYFGARYYESSSGRWLSIDPSADKYPNLSPYIYCLNNPLNHLDPDGNDPTGITETVGVALGVAIGTGILIQSTYLVTKNYLEHPSLNSFPSETNIKGVAIGIGVSLVNTISKLFSSEKGNEVSQDNGTVKEQADKISKEIGKNSVTLPDGTRVDLKGRGHRAKEGQKIETPHTHEAEQHTNPETGEEYTKPKKIPRPATQNDIDKVNNTLNNQ